MVQVWIAVNLGAILGALAVCFAASLVAAPLAFARERGLTAEFEFERERTRVRREARERVLGRLTELSQRIEAAPTGGPDPATDLMALAARDIDATVGELKEILGDLTDREGGDRA